MMYQFPLKEKFNLQLKKDDQLSGKLMYLEYVSTEIDVNNCNIQYPIVELSEITLFSAMAIAPMSFN